MSIFKSYRGLYFATFLMLLGTGLLSTYLALHVAERASSVWVGALMTSFYLGLVGGGKKGHRLIARVGHIRAYAAAAGIVCAAAIIHGLTDNLWIWLVLRMLVGVGMMCMYMVVESWLNEQSTSENRGKVFSGYMMASYLGMVVGQLMLASLPELGIELLLLVALCFSLCLVPVALTRRIHPEPLTPASLSPRYFYQQVPMAMFTTLLAGAVVGAFYGLAPLYASRIGMDTRDVGLFMAACVAAGFLVQMPLGRLSDTFERPKLIRLLSVLLLLVAAPLAVETVWPHWVFFVGGAATCAFVFSLYPLAVAFANDNIEPEKRVSLAAVLLAVFGAGASMGPLLVGSLMRGMGPNMLFVFFCVSAGLIALRVRPQLKTPETEVPEEPVEHLAMPDGLASSPLVVALDPRIEEEQVQEHMVEIPLEDGPDLAAETEEQHY